MCGCQKLVYNVYPATTYYHGQIYPNAVPIEEISEKDYLSDLPYGQDL